MLVECWKISNAITTSITGGYRFGSTDKLISAINCFCLAVRPSTDLSDIRVHATFDHSDVFESISPSEIEAKMKGKNQSHVGLSGEQSLRLYIRDVDSRISAMLYIQENKAVICLSSQSEESEVSSEIHKIKAAIKIGL